MAIEHVVVIGASAGGVEALRILAAGLRYHPATAYLVVLHITPSSPSHLAEILTAAGRLPALPVVDGAPVESGTIYVSEPDRHLYLEGSHLRSIRGPKENRHRPSVNTLFRSAAKVYESGAIGILLSGCLDDGTVGLWEIKRAGGIAIVQDPNEATFDSMPRNAIENVDVDYVVSVSEIPSIVNSLLANSVERRASTREDITLEQQTDLTCPECRGPLREVKLGRIAQLECRVGHSYSPESALDAHEDTQERTLWSAVVALEEGAEFALRLVDTHPALAAQLDASAQQKRAQAKVIRKMIGGARMRVPVTAA